ncbi:MAG: hypothetical protein U0269_27410 [Polyangiales bacterium]
MSQSSKPQRDQWRKLVRSRVAPLVERVFRPRRADVIPVLAAMTDVSESWLRGECERTSLEGMLVVLDVVRDRDGGAAYWERLCARGLLPIEWIEDPSRVFFSHCARRSNPEFVSPQLTPDVVSIFEDRSYLSHPKRALDALTLACDAPSLSAVESLARESLLRFSRITHGSPPSNTACWHTLRNGGTTEDLWPLTLPLLGAPFSRALIAPGEILAGSVPFDRLLADLQTAAPLRALLDLPNTRARPSRSLIAAALSYVLHSCAWTLFSDARISSETLDAHYGDFEDPFEPLVRVIESGYFIERFDANGVAVIAASL